MRRNLPGTQIACIVLLSIALASSNAQQPNEHRDGPPSTSDQTAKAIVHSLGVSDASVSKTIEAASVEMLNGHPDNALTIIDRTLVKDGNRISKNDRAALLLTRASAYKQIGGSANDDKINRSLQEVRAEAGGSPASQMIARSDATSVSTKSIEDALRAFRAIPKEADATAFVDEYISVNHSRTSIQYSLELLRVFMTRFHSSTQGPMFVVKVCNYLQTYEQENSALMLCADYARLDTFQSSPEFLIKYANLSEYSKKPNDALSLIAKSLEVGLSQKELADALLIKSLALRDTGDNTHALQALYAAKRAAQASNNQSVIQMNERLTLKGHSMDPDVLRNKHDDPAYKTTKNGLIGFCVFGGISVLGGFVLLRRRRNDNPTVKPIR